MNTAAGTSSTSGHQASSNPITNTNMPSVSSLVQNQTLFTTLPVTELNNNNNNSNFNNNASTNNEYSLHHSTINSSVNTMIISQSDNSSSQITSPPPTSQQSLVNPGLSLICF